MKIKTNVSELQPETAGTTANNNPKKGKQQ